MKKSVMQEGLKVGFHRRYGKTAIATKEYIIELQERISEAIRYIESLEEENKRLKKANENTIKIKVFYDDSSYEVDTQIEKKFIEGKDYYIADSYKEPTKIKFMEYEVSMSIDNHYIILAKVYDYFAAEIKTISFKRMCLTKHQASEQFLLKKWSK